MIKNQLTIYSIYLIPFLCKFVFIIPILYMQVDIYFEFNSIPLLKLQAEIGGHHHWRRKKEEN